MNLKDIQNRVAKAEAAPSVAKSEPIRGPLFVAKDAPRPANDRCVIVVGTRVMADKFNAGCPLIVEGK